MPPSLWHRLCPDLTTLILDHRAAMVIQQQWLRYTLFGHGRKKAWPLVREHLRLVGIWPRFAAYERMRREWRHEPMSWILADHTDLQWIEEEAQQGLWGRRSGRLVVC